MPLTVGSYHLWQLPVESSWEPEEGIEFSELRNDLGNGYRSQVLYGSNTGIRSWKLKLPTLAGSSLIAAGVTGINGETVTREQYVWDLFCETKVTGEPFVYQSQRNGQYYLVEFGDKRLSYEKMKVQLYSTGVELNQVRIDGATVFDLNQPSPSTGVWWYNETGHASPNWDAVDRPTTGEYGLDMAATGDVVFASNAQNGLNTVRLNTTLTTGKLTLDLDGGLWRELFMVMKVYEATFGQTSVVVANDGVEDVLVGTNATTKFAALPGGVGSYEYRLDGVLYASTNLQAPMNRWGVVHLRVPGGFASDVVIGQSQAGAGSQAEIGIAEVYATSTIYQQSICREIVEHLTVKWGIT